MFAAPIHEELVLVLTCDLTPPLPPHSRKTCLRRNGERDW